MARRAVSKRIGTGGDVFALVTDGASWEVWRLCRNYDGAVSGGMRRTWRYVRQGMDERTARELFARRTAQQSKQHPR